MQLDAETILREIARQRDEWQRVALDAPPGSAKALMATGAVVYAGSLHDGLTEWLAREQARASLGPQRGEGGGAP